MINTNNSKIVSHLRLIHFSIIIICLILLSTTLINSNLDIDQALLEAKLVKKISATPNSDVDTLCLQAYKRLPPRKIFDTRYDPNSFYFSVNFDDLKSKNHRSIYGLKSKLDITKDDNFVCTYDLAAKDAKAKYHSMSKRAPYKTYKKPYIIDPIWLWGAKTEFANHLKLSDSSRTLFGDFAINTAYAPKLFQPDTIAKFEAWWNIFKNYNLYVPDSYHSQYLQRFIYHIDKKPDPINPKYQYVTANSFRVKRHIHTIKTATKIKGYTSWKGVYYLKEDLQQLKVRLGDPGAVNRSDYTRAFFYFGMQFKHKGKNYELLQEAKTRIYPLDLQRALVKQHESTLNPLTKTNFASSFPNLNKFFSNKKYLAIENIIEELESIKKLHNQEVELFGTNIPIPLAILFGIIILISMLLYFLVHLKILIINLRMVFKINNDKNDQAFYTPWLGMYPKFESHLTVILTVVLLPVATAAYLIYFTEIRLFDLPYLKYILLATTAMLSGIALVRIRALYKITNVSSTL